MDKILQMAQWQTQGHQSEDYYSNSDVRELCVNSSDSGDGEKRLGCRFFWEVEQTTFADGLAVAV